MQTFKKIEIFVEYYRVGKDNVVHKWSPGCGYSVGSVNSVTEQCSGQCSTVRGGGV